MNEYINLTLENIDDEHICCAIGDKKHQAGVDSKKEWIKSKLKDGHIFRKLNTRGKIFIEYEPIETAWIPISGKNYEYIYCLWVAGSFKGKGIGKELLEYAINDSKEKVINISKSFNIDAQIIGHIEEGEKSLTIKSEFGEFNY